VSMSRYTLSLSTSFNAATANSMSNLVLTILIRFVKTAHT
jgi:hypothetical protein